MRSQPESSPLYRVPSFQRFIVLLQEIYSSLKTLGLGNPQTNLHLEIYGLRFHARASLSEPIRLLSWPLQKMLRLGKFKRVFSFLLVNLPFRNVGDPLVGAVSLKGNVCIRYEDGKGADWPDDLESSEADKASGADHKGILPIMMAVRRRLASI